MNEGDGFSTVTMMGLKVYRCLIFEAHLLYSSKIAAIDPDVGSETPSSRGSIEG